MAYYRSFELDISPFDTHHSNFTTLYAVVSIVTPSSVTSQKAILATWPDNENLTWEPYRKLRFVVEESKIQDESATLMIRFRGRRTFMIDRAIGHVGFIPLKKLLDDHHGTATFHIIELNEKPSAHILTFAYKFSRRRRSNNH